MPLAVDEGLASFALRLARRLSRLGVDAIRARSYPRRRGFGLLPRIGLDLMAAVPAPYDEANVGRGGLDQLTSGGQTIIEKLDSVRRDGNFAVVSGNA